MFGLGTLKAAVDRLATALSALAGTVEQVNDGVRERLDAEPLVLENRVAAIEENGRKRKA